MIIIRGLILNVGVLALSAGLAIPAHAGGGPISVMAIRPCSILDLVAAAGWGGAGGEEHGGIHFTNHSASACTLKGRLTVHLSDAMGRVLRVTTRYAGGFDPSLQQGLPSQDARLGIVRPGFRAYADVAWGNWCGGIVKEPLTLLVTLPSGGQLHARVNDYFGRPGQPARTPMCAAPSLMSILSIGSIEPVSRSAYLPG